MKRTYEQNKARAMVMNKRRFMMRHRELKPLFAMNEPEEIRDEEEAWSWFPLKEYYAYLKEQAEAAGQWEAAYTFYTQMVEYV